MKRHVAAVVVLVTAFLVVDSHVDWVRLDGRNLMMVSGQPFDVRGWAAESVLQLRRDCAPVNNWPSDSETAREVLQVLQQHSLPDSQSARWLQLHQLGDWAVAEVAFDRLKPTWVVLRLQTGQWRVLDPSVWSGSTAPWHSGDFVRRYLRQQVPDLPLTLLNCLRVDPVRYGPGPGGLGPTAGPAPDESFPTSAFSTAAFLTAGFSNEGPASATFATPQALTAAVSAEGPP